MPGSKRLTFGLFSDFIFQCILVYVVEPVSSRLSMPLPAGIFTYFQRTLFPQVIAAFTSLFHSSLNSMLLHQRFFPSNTNDAPSYYSKAHGPSAHLAKSCDMYVHLHAYCLYIVLEYKFPKR